MMPLSQNDRNELETRLGCKLCPYIGEDAGHVATGILADSEMPISLFYCSIDGKTARGGQQSKKFKDRALRPCLEDFADECELYQLQSNRVSTVVNGMPGSIDLKPDESYFLKAKVKHTPPGFGATARDESREYIGIFVRASGDQLYFSSPRNPALKPDLQFSKASLVSIDTRSE